MRIFRSAKGQVLMQAVTFGVLAISVISGLVGWAVFSIKAMRQTQNREKSAEIAEAGIEYYRWHLAHAPHDYQDGTGAPGPYTHEQTDKDGNVVGRFILDITPPPPGSTIVKIRSTGKVDADLGVTEKIEVRLAIPSLALYAVASNADIRFGVGTEIFGPIHANSGIRFDGLAHNIITSTKASYQDPDHVGGPEFGVHTHVAPVDPLPPAAVPSRPDVFAAGRQFPMPAIDFAGFTADLAQIKADAQASGRYYANSGFLGYHVVLKTDDTYDLYVVKALAPPPATCTNSQGQSGWGSWSIGTGAGAQTFIANAAFPANGLIFLEDNVWIDGTIDTTRVTVASARFPDDISTRTSITINDDLTYTNHDGRDVISLMAQQHVNVGLYAQDDLRIDGALIAQNGRVGRYYYRPAGGSNYCAPYDRRQILTLDGMIVSSQRYGFAYSDGTGYQVRKINYDPNLLYEPPPSLPLTSNQYVTLSWRRVK